MKNKILIKRNILEITNKDRNAPYYATKLLNKFGVLVDKPTELSKDNFDTIANFYGVNVPNSFYNNPQDLKYYTCDELLVEQLVSYFSIEYISGVNSQDEKSFDRIELFKKALPNYKEGNEVVFRNYQMLTHEESEIKLKEIVSDLCKYTRKWSIEENAEFKWLYLNDYYQEQHIECKDNAIELFLEYKNSKFAKMLDKKDVVKLSIELKGELDRFTFTSDEKTILEVAIKNAYDCPLSKKQAKYFNTISKKVGIKGNKQTNEQSPYKKAKQLLSNGDVLGASKEFAKNGSLLERNIVWLLSRAKPTEFKDILDLIKVNNPIVLIQLLQGIIADDYSNNRVFRFYNNRRLKTHNETETEHKYRKSILSIGAKQVLREVLEEKITEYYNNLESLGDIYISTEFENIALPLNTSATGSGLDVLPVGSRLPITDDYIRTFCYWNNAFDIDTSVIFVKENGNRDVLFWGNYSNRQFGDSALCSGDDRSSNGAEYCDFRISELKALGYKYAIYVLNGYNSTLNSGEIYCGYQNKKDLETKTWSPKNIALKINVKGESRAYMGFAIDFETNEVVILNQILNSNDRVVDDKTYKTIENYLTKDYLMTYNMYKLLKHRGNIVDDIEKANIVFDRNYVGKENQQVIKPYQIEKLVSLLK